MIYILDFDRTLFDTPSYYLKVAELGLEKIQFDPEIWQHISSCDFLYEDVLNWLSSQDKQDLYILTAVSPEYGDGKGSHQKAKLACSQVEERVAKVIFTTGMKGENVAEIAKQFPPQETFVFVDDSIDQCLSVKSHLPDAICCLMVRDKSLIGDIKNIQGIKVVHCLSDVDDIIEKS